MSKLTGQEILKFLEYSGIPAYNFAYEHYRPEHKFHYMELRRNLGDWKVVAQKGGENQGSEWYSVKYFEDHDVYIKIDGWYSSYVDTEFENYGVEVKPQEKTITVYE